jgi:hypothetical protein
MALFDKEIMNYKKTKNTPIHLKVTLDQEQNNKMNSSKERTDRNDDDREKIDKVASCKAE